MNLTIRYFQNEKDIELQYAFWETVTAELPFAWKPTFSPKLFLHQKEFDLKSRCFAFDGDRLVGHMGFTGKGNFVSLGYPWVLEGYEGELQEEMYELIYSYASGPSYGGEVFAQRFRVQWKDQINFFLEKGFEITGRSPIYGREVHLVDKSDTNVRHSVQVQEGFDIEQFLSVAQDNPELTEEHIAFYREYYQAVDFDFAVKCLDAEKLVAYFGITIRHDTKYSEIIACTVAKDDPLFFKAGITKILEELSRRGARTVSIYESLAPNTDVLQELQFEQVTEDVMVIKKTK